MSPADFEDEQADFDSRYSAMSDRELLKIAQQPWLLSDTAFDALEDELERRGLDLPEPESPPQVSALEKRNLVMLRRFRDIPEALLAKGKLESAGVECFLGDENTVRMDWLWSNLLGGVKILVTPEDFAEASEILNEPIPAILEFEEKEIYDQPPCPKCRSLDISFQEVYKPVAYASLLVSFPFPIQRSGWICHTCGNTWEDRA
jgi:hypothetical protein